MPPFAVDRLKAAAKHGTAQEHTVLILLLCDTAKVGMRHLAEAVERTAHVELLAGRHIQQGKIDRTAAAVGGLLGDIAL